MKSLNLIGPVDAPEVDILCQRYSPDYQFGWWCQLCEMDYGDNVDKCRTYDGYRCCPRCLELEGSHK